VIIIETCSNSFYKCLIMIMLMRFELVWLFVTFGCKWRILGFW